MQMKVVYQYSLYLIIGFIGLTCMAGGPFGIDHMITKDDNGVWSRQKQLDLQYGSFLFVVSGSLLGCLASLEGSGRVT